MSKSTLQLKLAISVILAACGSSTSSTGSTGNSTTKPATDSGQDGGHGLGDMGIGGEVSVNVDTGSPQTTTGDPTTTTPANTDATVIPRPLHFRQSRDAGCDRAPC